MLYLRSLTFNAAFYINTLVQMIVFTRSISCRRGREAWWIAKNWARSNLWLQKLIAGTHSRIDGLENLPEGLVHPGAQAPVALGHDRLLPHHLDDPVYILKRETDLDSPLRLVCDEDAHDRHRPGQPIPGP